MPQYRVTLHYTAWQEYLIEADTPEHAKETAYNGELVAEDTTVTSEKVEEILPEQPDLFANL